jgi:uncharacterized RDD family membrane protein YckC
MKLATWNQRFLAWLIDILIIAFAIGPFQIAGLINVENSSLIFLIYWTLMDWKKGQSVGKMALDIKVIRKNKKKINLETAFIESVGKSILLPLDCLIGWLLYPKKKLRLFNKISNTIVVRTKKK